MIAYNTYQDYSDYLSSIIEAEYIISDTEMSTSDTAFYLEAPVNDPNVISLKNEITRSVNKSNDSFINQYTAVDNLIISLQIRIINDYGDLNEYLQDNGIIVGYYFALSSDRLGFTIDDENIEYVILEAGSSYTTDGDVRLKFDVPDSLTTAIVIIYGELFTVGVSNDQFIWDFGGSGEYTFIGIGDSISRVIAGNTVYISWLGYASFIFELSLDAPAA